MNTPVPVSNTHTTHTNTQPPADDAATIKSAALSAVDKASAGAVSELLAAGGFEAKQGQSTRAVRSPGAKAGNVALVGLGKRDKAVAVPEWGASAYQSAGAAVASICKANRFKSAALALLSPPASQPEAAAARAASGALQGAYESTRFKSKAPKGARLESLALVGFGGAGAGGAANADALKLAIKQGASVAVGALLTRYLVEAPPNVCTPSHLAAAAEHIAARAPERFSLEVLEAGECKDLGMGCFLGVAEASHEPAKFIHLTYKPEGPAKKVVAVVGKGLTFDSGGYNLKAGAGSMIELMKFDMGGAAATLGAARVLAGTQPEGVEVRREMCDMYGRCMRWGWGRMCVLDCRFEVRVISDRSLCPERRTQRRRPQSGSKPTSQPQNQTQNSNKTN